MIADKIYTEQRLKPLQLPQIQGSYEIWQFDEPGMDIIVPKEMTNIIVQKTKSHLHENDPSLESGGFFYGHYVPGTIAGFPPGIVIFAASNDVGQRDKNSLTLSTEYGTPPSNLETVGIWHTHPNGICEFSEEDIHVMTDMLQNAKTYNPIISFIATQNKRALALGYYTQEEEIEVVMATPT